jgi:hypothetical protein
MPRNSAEPELNPTEAYHTVEARLTFISQPTEQPDSTSTPDTSSNAFPTIQPTGTRTPAGPCDIAVAGYPQMDITVPDDTRMMPGEPFTKIWRLSNSGTCVWTGDYQLVFFSGDQLANTKSIQLNRPVEPSEEIDLAVEMTAPEDPGTYQSNWKLQNVNGEYFGIGPSGGSPLWVRIEVIEVNTETPEPTATFTPTPSTMVSGDVVIREDQLLDLDTLQIQEASADVRLASVGETNPPTYQLQPRNSARMSLFGSARPTLDECKSASMDNQPIELSDVAFGVYYCYRTDMGLPGWFYTESLNTEDSTVYLVIHTWLQP